MNIYADTSVLFSLYAPDANSIAASHYISQRSRRVFLTPLLEIELTNALNLRVFRRELDSAEVDAALSAFTADREAGLFISEPLPVDLFHRAKGISERHTPRIGTRTLDILHVVSALSLGARAFYTFDEKQRALARAAGLKVI